MSYEDPMLQVLLKPKNYYHVNFENIKTWEDMVFVLKAVLDGVTISDVHPLFEELREKGFIDAKQVQ